MARICAQPQAWAASRNERPLYHECRAELSRCGAPIAINCNGIAADHLKFGEASEIDDYVLSQPADGGQTLPEGKDFRLAPEHPLEVTAFFAASNQLL